MGLATDARQRRLSGWITTGPVLELDLLSGRATTAPDSLSYALGLRVGGVLTPSARRSVAAMIAGQRLASAVPVSALTTKELSAWTLKFASSARPS